MILKGNHKTAFFYFCLELWRVYLITAFGDYFLPAFWLQQLYPLARKWYSPPSWPMERMLFTLWYLLHWVIGPAEWAVLHLDIWANGNGLRNIFALSGKRLKNGTTGCTKVALSLHSWPGFRELAIFSPLDLVFWEQTFGLLPSQCLPGNSCVTWFGHGSAVWFSNNQIPPWRVYCKCYTRNNLIP